jgi:hypothetical protein
MARGWHKRRNVRKQLQPLDFQPAGRLRRWSPTPRKSYPSVATCHFEKILRDKEPIFLYKSGNLFRWRKEGREHLFKAMLHLGQNTLRAGVYTQL